MPQWSVNTLYYTGTFFITLGSVFTDSCLFELVGKTSGGIAWGMMLAVKVTELAGGIGRLAANAGVAATAEALGEQAVPEIFYGSLMAAHFLALIVYAIIYEVFYSLDKAQSIVDCLVKESIQVDELKKENCKVEGAYEPVKLDIEGIPDPKLEAEKAEKEAQAIITRQKEHERLARESRKDNPTWYDSFISIVPQRKQQDQWMSGNGLFGEIGSWLTGPKKTEQTKDNRSRSSSIRSVNNSTKPLPSYNYHKAEQMSSEASNSNKLSSNLPSAIAQTKVEVKAENIAQPPSQKSSHDELKKADLKNVHHSVASRTSSLREKFY